MRGFHKAIIGSIIGAATAGIWLTIDLILPEPYGDYLLFILMGMVNMVIGWQIGRLLTKNDPLKSTEKGINADLHHAETIAKSSEQ